MNEEHSGLFRPVCSPSSLPLTASSPCFLSNPQLKTHTCTQRHTVMHKRTYTNTRPEVIQSRPLFRRTRLLMFLHLCVRVCMLVFPLSSGLKTTELHLPLPPSFSLPLSLGFIFPPSAVVRERQAQPFLQIPGPHLTQTACGRSAPELVPCSELSDVSCWTLCKPEPASDAPPPPSFLSLLPSFRLT